MWLLIRAKVKVGTALASPAIIADAACTRACLYLSVVLLAASAGYMLTGIGWFDSLGTLGIAGFSVKEGGRRSVKPGGCPAAVRDSEERRTRDLPGKT